MPTLPIRAETGWMVRSVPIRTRDGAKRLDQAYRRLLDDPPPAAPPSPPGEPAMRAALYARVSTERQERYQPSDGQLAALRAWAATQGHAVADEHVFRDEGYSGSRLDRPGLDALRDAVRDGAVQQVAALTPDRLARKYAYQVPLLEAVPRAGCEVVFLPHPLSGHPHAPPFLHIH